MGLAIYGYSKLARFEDGECTKEDVSCTEEELEETEKYYPGRTAGLQAGLFTFDAKERVGISYFAYTHWREQLAIIAGYDKQHTATSNDPVEKRFIANSPHTCNAFMAKEGPFWELITFFDSCGVIGPVVCAKLSKDFEEHAGKLKDSTVFFRHTYTLIHKAVMLAADNGMLVFC